jgi:hypothetical protein
MKTKNEKVFYTDILDCAWISKEPKTNGLLFWSSYEDTGFVYLEPYY